MDLSTYTRPVGMTSAGRYAPLLSGLPRDVRRLAAVAQGLLIHEHLAEHYGVNLSAADRATVHVRPVEGLLEQIVSRDDRPLHVAREPAARVAGNCRHFTVLTAAMLRAQGTPARARCGFGGYFTPGWFEDHWVCEYWHFGRRQWLLLDAQIDDPQRGWFGIDFDVADVPRDQFWVAGQAWRACRSGTADPARFGLTLVGEAGEWWIAENLVRDSAALRNIEVLPWDSWGAMPGPDKPIDGGLAALLDRLADLTQSPDAHHAELEKLCEDDRLRVPGTVRNAARNRDEALVTAVRSG